MRGVLKVLRASPAKPGERMLMVELTDILLDAWSIPASPSECPAVPKSPPGSAASPTTCPNPSSPGGRYRELVTKTENGDSNTRSIGSGNKPSKPARLVVELESGDDTRVQLVRSRFWKTA